jgi:DNA-directed RNA polymerase specialized sigma24 family protein
MAGGALGHGTEPSRVGVLGLSGRLARRRWTRRPRGQGGHFSDSPLDGGMAGVLQAASQSAVTHRLIDEFARSWRAGALRAQLAARSLWATEDEVADAVQEACTRASRHWRGSSMPELYRWLSVVAGNVLVDAYRERGRESPAPNMALTGDDFSSADPEKVALEREDQAEVDALARAIVDRLSERQQQITALHAEGQRRPQIARHLGLTDRIVKRELEEVFALGRDELVQLAGCGCDEGRRAIARLSFGLAKAREVRDAQLHLLGCSQCAALYDRLEEWRGRVASLLPVPVASSSDPRWVASAVDHVAAFLGDGGRGVARAASGVRQHASALVGQAKQQAGSAYYRAVDPTPLAAVRPGTAAAALASCLAIGGGTTYCLNQGVSPLSPFRGGGPRASSVKHAKPKARKAQAELPAPPIVAPPQQQNTVPAGSDSAGPSSPPPPPPVPEEEFEPEAPEPAVAQSAGSTSSSSPAPAPNNGPSEFEP